MVLILSENLDPSTIEIQKWLDHFGVPWLRVNEDDEIAFDTLEYKDNVIHSFVIMINGRPLDLTRIRSYWYRRGTFRYNGQRISKRISDDPVINQQLYAHLNEELDHIMAFVHHYLRQEKPSINSYLNAQNNKTYYLLAAARAGFDIPDTLIGCTKEKLESFATMPGPRTVITKSINELFSFSHKRKIYATKTYAVDEHDRACGPARFYPTLFQSYIDKFCELRIFYLLGQMYTMAIFSQQNEKTKLDFRNYDHDHANRNVPFRLPDSVEQQIRSFMADIDLNCGSLDIILTADNRFVFLEVNPVGQFGMVSYPCNYRLEQKIATALTYTG